ncbi:hypothetical protein [Pseudactinotalea suaedae]|uniref:hypothetical protein n=1 Tax=Pseudactinotalea suaedae TaxID=1524924 RepID=UPI0012E14831|nr:hypothetical protein [Pseudactinotalea suaedae]
MAELPNAPQVAGCRTSTAAAARAGPASEPTYEANDSTAVTTPSITAPTIFSRPQPRQTHLLVLEQPRRTSQGIRQHSHLRVQLDRQEHREVKLPEREPALEEVHATLTRDPHITRHRVEHRPHL